MLKQWDAVNAVQAELARAGLNVQRFAEPPDDAMMVNLHLEDDTTEADLRSTARQVGSRFYEAGLRDPVHLHYEDDHWPVAEGSEELKHVACVTVWKEAQAA